MRALRRSRQIDTHQSPPTCITGVTSGVAKPATMITMIIMPTTTQAEPSTLFRILRVQSGPAIAYRVE